MNQPSSCSETKTVPTEAIEKFREPGGDILHLAPIDVQYKLKAIEAFQQIVHKSLVRDLDYGVIPGTQKPTLLKPGAEKIAKLLNLADTYEIVDKVEDWDKPFFSYTIRCTLTEISSGAVVCSYLANCNSYESKYRWRWVPQWKLQKGQVTEGVYYEERTTARGPAKFYRFPNDEIFSQINTVMKMSEKRALTSAVLSVGRLSLIFTVDMEDYHQEPAGGEGVGSTTVADGKLTKATVKPAEAANVRSSGVETPSPPKKSKLSAARIENGRYTDDEYPPDATFRLPDGTEVEVSKYKAYDLFEKMKKAVGEKKYYEILGSVGYLKKNDVPAEMLHLVYAMLVNEWVDKKKGGK